MYHITATPLPIQMLIQANNREGNIKALISFYEGNPLANGGFPSQWVIDKESVFISRYH